MAVDKAGRIVVPKALRDQLGLEPGTELEAEVEGGRLVARPIGPEVVLVLEGGRLVATSPSATKMTDDELRLLVDQNREWPHSF
ncbi:MAG TPA: AbrB/MazE/SpoVT family DNA-binding domain-containing protein [Candidatus Dormibacteraeota bacterium]|nr:AbrB/MazE/SpoVT family DNA-binding domain-containing protein [Candidatus Dormibacteraeota bacterium]